MTITLLAEPAIQWLLSYSLHSALLCALGLVVARLWLAPGARLSAVLKVALFGALISASVPWKAVPAWEVLGQAGSTEQASGLGMAVGALGMGSEAMGNRASSAVANAEGISAPSSLGVTAAESAGYGRWVLGCGVVMGLISLLAIARLALLRRSFLRSLNRVASADLGAAALLASWSQAAKRRPVHLSESATLASPVALSSTEICVPSSCWSALDQADRGALLAHEFAHIERRDPFWFAAGAVSERLFFFLPWHRLLHARFCAAAEVACDAAAARRVDSTTAVASCLASVAGWARASNGSRPVPASVPAMSRTSADLLPRVRQLLKGQDRPVSVPFSLGAALLFLGFSCSTPSVSTGGPGVPAVLAGDDSAIVISLQRDGTATASRSSKFPKLAPVTVAMNTRFGKGDLVDWIVTAAADIPPYTLEGLMAKRTTLPASSNVRRGSFTIEADGSVELKYGLRAMALAGDVRVQMPDVEFRIDGESFPVPLPIDLTNPGLGPYGVQTLYLRIDSVEEGAGVSYSLTSSLGSGGIGVPEEVVNAEATPPAPSPTVYSATSLRELRHQINGIVLPGKEINITFEGRQGVRFGTMAQVLKMLQDLGHTQFTFIGSYER